MLPCSASPRYKFLASSCTSRPHKSRTFVHARKGSYLAVYGDFGALRKTGARAERLRNCTQPHAARAPWRECCWSPGSTRTCGGTTSSASQRYVFSPCFFCCCFLHLIHRVGSDNLPLHSRYVHSIHESRRRKLRPRRRPKRSGSPRTRSSKYQGVDFDRLIVLTVSYTITTLSNAL